MSNTEGMIENKIKKQTKLVTIDLEAFRDHRPIDVIDLKDYLFQGLILKENDFREAMAAYDWSQHEDHYIAVQCSTDAIIAPWAYMLVAQHALGHAEQVFKGTRTDAQKALFAKRLADHDWSQYENKFVLLKGCSKQQVPESVYVSATNYLLPHVSKLMYGEACSSVPVYKQPRSSKRS
jgi:hypothetical protein